MRNSQALRLQEKLLDFNSRFNDASDGVRDRMLKEMDRELQMLTREEENISRIQDPSEIRGRRGRTLGKRGSRRHTAAEVVERELKRSDREASRSSKQRTDRPTSFTLSSGMPQDSEITVPDSWITDDVQSLPNVPFNARSNQPSSSLSSNISSRTQHKRAALHESIVVQPFKRVRKENRE